MKRLVVVEVDVRADAPHLCDKKCEWLRPAIGSALTRNEASKRMCTLFEKRLGVDLVRTSECLAAQVKPGDEVG